MLTPDREIVLTSASIERDISLSALIHSVAVVDKFSCERLENYLLDLVLTISIIRTDSFVS